MPSVYTADVMNGKITTLPEFAMRCARAFGALVMMRDETLDAPIPDRLEPDTKYHDNAIAEAQRAIAEILGMTDIQCAAAAKAEYDAQLESYENRVRDRTETRRRYESMLAQVSQWQPAPEIAELKSFMLKQLQDSIEWDCDGSYDVAPILAPSSLWRSKKIKIATNDLTYHTEKRGEEIARVDARNKWLATLRASLAKPE